MLNLTIPRSVSSTYEGIRQAILTCLNYQAIVSYSDSVFPLYFH